MNTLRLSRRPLAFFLALLIAVSSLSCYSRAQIKPTRLPKIKDISDLQILLIDSSAPISNMWIVSEPKFETNALSGQLTKSSEGFATRINTIRTNSDRIASKNMVLIYLSPTMAKSMKDSVPSSIDYKHITKIEVFEPDAGKVVLTILTGLIGIAAIGLIILIVTCNCPHVYAETADGSRQLEGSLYSGAIYPKLERSDYLPLEHLQPADNQYKIWLANEESQRQHTNIAELEVIDHAPGLQPVFDKYGTLHTLNALQSPFEAFSVSGQNVLPALIDKDQNTYLGELDQPKPNPVEKLTLSFAKPRNVHQAKLLLRAKTDPWVDYVFHEFKNELGEFADEVDKKYRRKSASETQNWVEQQKLPIAVWLETAPNQWQKVDHFGLAGASAFRNDVLQIDLSKVQGETVRIRLEYGFHFWDIDQVALDFSSNQRVQQSTLRPLFAKNHLGQDVTANLTDDDARYYDQPNIGDEALLHFEVPALTPGLERSLVLHAKGHYEILHSNAPGRPRLRELNAWKKEDALPQLSVQRWLAAKSMVAH